MKTERTVACLLTMLIMCGVCFAQKTSVFSGRIIDTRTKDAVPFATVRVKNKSLGVVANADGDFSIPTWVETSGDTIVVSSIGYTTAFFPTNIFSHETVTVLPLKPAVTELDEIVVRSKDHKVRSRGEPSTSGIITSAIKNIPNNYPQQPYSYLGYYRDYQVRDSTYINLNEAIVEVFDKGFATNDQLQTEIELFEYKRNEDFKRDSSTEVPYDNKPNAYDKMKNKYIPNAVLFSYGGNELSILRLHDAIRNFDKPSYSFVNVLNKDLILNHYLKREDDVWLDTLSLYVITFETKYAASGPLHFGKGKIYIEKKNFAIHKLEYAVFNKTMKETVLMYDIKVEYANHNDKFYLNYISFNNVFKTQNDVDFKVIKFEYNPIMNAFVVSFNAPPNPVDLADVNNFRLTHGDIPFNIKYIERIEERKAAIYVDGAARDIMRKQNDRLSSDLDYAIKLRDINNRELDRHTVPVISQFRELFVEQVHPSEAIQPNATVIRKDVPLVSNPAVSKADGNYWMNPPLLSRKARKTQN
ncbi:MAG: carboxypeptidase-like regulatory domain-containing protein [Bacteroidota bacterium]